MKNILFTLALIVCFKSFGQTPDDHIIWMDTKYDSNLLIQKSTQKLVNGILFFRPTSGIKVKYGPIQGDFYGYKINFIDGIKNGLAKFYCSSGQLQMKGAYINDRKVGTWISYHLNKRIQELDDSSQKIYSLEDAFFEIDNISRKIEYDNGKIVSEECYNKNGQLIECF